VSFEDFKAATTEEKKSIIEAPAAYDYMLLKLSQPILRDKYIDISCNYPGDLDPTICCYGFPKKYAI